MFWKNRSKNVDVFFVTAPVYVFARIFGFWPFSVQFAQSTSTSVHVHMNCFDSSWFAIAISYFTFFGWLSFVKTQDYLPYSAVELLVFKMLQVGSVVVSISTIIVDVVNRNRIWNIIVKFNQFDNEVKLTNSQSWVQTKKTSFIQRRQIIDSIFFSIFIDELVGCPPGFSVPKTIGIFFYLSDCGSNIFADLLHILFAAILLSSVEFHPNFLVPTLCFYNFSTCDCGYYLCISVAEYETTISSNQPLYEVG